jgi:cysteine-rich repeat protein
MRASRSIALALALAAAIASLAACGDNIKPEVDQPVYICGNGVVEPGEDCDDDDAIKDTVCDATCHFTCGNGVVDAEADIDELCDTGIASGSGACPRSCDDGVACTDDVLSGAECRAECVHSAITARVTGDGCCPVGADAATDGDCSSICGNGIVEPGEICDTAIVAGAGACPIACSDGLVCTTDVLSSGGTCQAACSFPPITTPANGDGCCPSGANSTTDNDCVATCGNGVVEPPSETCDTGIASGAGACPTMCDDGVACTANLLGNAGTCQAVCVFPPITAPANGDSCCPTGANANNDNDCAPVCGNGATEPGEQCDDGNANNGDACANNCTTNVVPTAFRFSDLDLRDPHVFYSIIGCNDLTDASIFFSVNSEIQDSIQTDADNNGSLDFSPTLVFRPFSQTAATMPLEVHFATCSAPLASTSCTATTGGMVTMATATNVTSGSCLAPLPGTTKPYSPGIVSPTPPCFVTSAITVTITLGGIPITLQNAQVSARYVGNPATSLTNGLLRGFISETDANNTIIPASFPVVGGQPLSKLLPGGVGACPSYSDKDVSSSVTGWWFYLNFPATRVPWS